MISPEKLQKKLDEISLRYIELYGHYERAKGEACFCDRVAAGKCLKCQKIYSLVAQMHQTVSLNLTLGEK